MHAGLDTRWVFVTGANGGIGSQACVQLQERGFSVIGGIRSKPGEHTWQACTHLVRFDLGKPDTVAEAAKEVLELTKGRLSGLVNGAGIAVPLPFELLPESEADRQIDVNLRGPMRLTRALLPALRQEKGRIVNVTSVAGRMPMPFNAVHCGTKHFLEGWSDCLRIELAEHGVKVVVIEPGMIRTEMLETALSASKHAVTAWDIGRDSPYDRGFSAMLARMRSHIDSGSPPEEVAEAIALALTADRPQTRYPVGARARPMSLLARFLPDRTKDALVSRLFGLNGSPA